MRRPYYRIAGAFDLRIEPRGDGTLLPIDGVPLEAWTREAAERAGFVVHALVATDGAVRIVAVADSAAAVLRLWRWAPRLVARPLHTVIAYVQALDAIGRARRSTAVLDAALRSV